MKRNVKTGLVLASLLGGLFVGTNLQETAIAESSQTTATSHLAQRAVAAERASRSKDARLGTADLEERVAEHQRLEAEKKAQEEARRAAEEKKRQEAAARAAAKKKALKKAPAASAPASGSNYSGGNTVWDRLAKCESGGNWAINTGNGYYGGLQFSLGSWRGVGGSGYPHQASKAEQIKRGKMLQASGGWGHWPACSKKLGLR